jgi:hypothetical protein
MAGDGADRPKRRAVATHGLHAIDHSLLGRVGDRPAHFAVENDIKAEGTRAAAEDALRSQVTEFP